MIIHTIIKLQTYCLERPRRTIVTLFLNLLPPEKNGRCGIFTVITHVFYLQMKVKTIMNARYAYGQVIESVQYYQSKAPGPIATVIGKLVQGMQWFGKL